MSEEIERLRQRVAALEEQLSATEEHVDDVVRDVFNHRYRLRRLEDEVAGFRSERFDARRVERKEVGHHSGSDAQLNISGKLLTEGGFGAGDKVSVATYEGRVVVELVEGIREGSDE